MSDCICEGNWRNIINECKELIGHGFKDENGRIWHFFGVVWRNEDFYYGMLGDDGTTLIMSCVVSLESHGYEIIPETKEVW